MSDTLDILRQIALQVRNASAPAENTAERVGRVLVGILERLSESDIDELKAMFLRKDQPDEAAELITFIEGLISQGLIEAKGGIKLPSGAALYSLYENGLLAFSMDENGFVIYEKGTANKWSVITHAGAEFQNLVIKFLAQITDLEVSNKATTLDLVVQALAKTYNLTVDNTADIMHGIIREYLTSESFVSGFLGSGFKIWKDANGDWNGEFDKLTVRKIFTVFELVVQKVVHQGGMVIRSAAGGKLVKVTDGGSYWKCEHDSTDDFLLDDQVLCQTFTGVTVKRYWRKVTSAGAGYFNLSKTDCEAGSANPEVGDDVAVLGNRTNTDRQSAQIDCAVGVNAPYRDDYAGINSYSLAGKLINRTGNLSGITDPDFGVLSGSGLIGMNAYLKGVFRLKSSGKLVEDAISDAQSESNAYTDGKITTVETNFEIREGQISSKVTQATTAATQASGYATSAQGSASTATTKAGEASTSATNAANSANQASNILTTVVQKETSINQTAEAIELKAVRAESAAGRAESAEASINLKADGIVLQASSQAAQSAVNGVQIGGRNLILNSADYWFNGSDFMSNVSLSKGEVRVLGKGDFNCHKTWLPLSITPSAGNTLTFSVDVWTDGNYCHNTSLFFNFRAGSTYYGSENITLPNINRYIRYGVTVQIPADAPSGLIGLVGFNGTNGVDGPGLIIRYRNLQCEVGNKFSDWSPAPEDVTNDAQAKADAAKSSAVSTAATDATTKANTAESNAKTYSNNTFTTKTEFSSQLTILSNSISAKVSQTDFNSLNTRVTSAEQKITSDAIISTVSSTITTAKNEAINAAAADATTKANNAKSSAVSTAATDATTKANTAESNAKTYSNNTFTTKTEFSSQLTILSNSISAKVSQTDFNSLNTRVTSAEQKITSDAIISTVSSTITTAKNEAINAAAADATTKANNAKSSAVSTAATDATTKANTAESNAKTYSNNTFTPLMTYNTKIAQLESSISLKADSTTVNGINNRLQSAEVKITPQQINLTVADQITEKVNAVQVGGRNLLLNSAEYWFDGSDFSSASIREQNKITVISSSKFNAHKTWMPIAPIGSLLNKTFTYSIDVKINQDAPNAYAWFNVRMGNTSYAHFVDATRNLNNIPINEWVRISLSLSVTDGYLGDGLGLCGFEGVGNNGLVIEYRNQKLEKGNKATDWTPAPEDVDASIALRPTTEEIKSQFTMDSSGISMMGKKIALTGLITFSSLASDAQTKITSAQSTAESALANAGTANQSIGTLQSSLGQMAYQNMVSLAKLDSTIVEGGYLKTSLIDANAIVTGSLLANKIAATDITTTRLTVSEGCTVGGFAIGNGRIGSIASATGSGGELAIYSNFFRVGGSDGYVMLGNNVIPATAGGAFNATGRIVNQTVNQGAYWGYDACNTGLYISVSGGTKNFGIDSNAALKAPAFINTRVKYLVFGTSYLIDLSQYSVFMCYAASAKSVIMPDETSIAKQFSLSSLPSDFGCIFTFHVIGGSSDITLNNVIDWNMSSINLRLAQGDSVQLLVTKFPNFHYQVINHTD